MKNPIRIAALLLSLLTLLALCSCGGGTEEGPKDEKVTLDVSETADKLLAAAKFDDAMNKTDKDVVDMKLGTAGLADEVAAYSAESGATAEFLILFHAVSEEKTEELLSLCRSFRDTQKEDFTSYNPLEVPKLENAVIISRGEYVLYCVAKDSSSVAADFEAYFKK